jgi:uncharacterized protein (TIGR00730 family)
MNAAAKRLGRVCVFCGSSAGLKHEYRAAAENFGRELAARRIGLVFGGGGTGLMRYVADAVLAAGGHAIGVIPDALLAREVGHPSLPDLRVVGSMHERKALMADLSDAFVALPGGFGTFEELCEAITWTQLGLHRKRCGILNVDGFYDPLLALFDGAVGSGFISEDSRHIVFATDDPRTLLDHLASPVAPPGTTWLRSSEQT